MKIFQIIVLISLSSCSHREGVDFPVGDRSYNIAFMSGHGYFVPNYVPDYLPPNPPPNFTPTGMPSGTPSPPVSYTGKSIK